MLTLLQKSVHHKAKVMKYIVLKHLLRFGGRFGKKGEL